LIDNEERNATLVTQTENSLFTTFTKEIAGKVTVTPQYVKVKTAEINAMLWELVKWFFAGKSGYSTDDDTQTLHVGITPQKVFTGTSLRTREYSMSNKTLTITSSVARNVINEIFWRGVPESGDMTVEYIETPSEICLYRIKVGADWQRLASCYAFIGQTIGGETLTDEQCREIMKLPATMFSANGRTYGERDGNDERPLHPFDRMIDPHRTYAAPCLRRTESAKTK